MTEMETLKKEADKQKATQMYKELEKYIDTLLKRADVQLQESRKKTDWNSYTALSLMAASVVNIFIGNPYLMVVQAVLLVTLSFTFLISQHSMMRLGETISELDGCFRTMEILGLLPKNERPKVPKKVKESVLEKSWASAKRAIQFRPYGQTKAA